MNDCRNEGMSSEFAAAEGVCSFRSGCIQLQPSLWNPNYNNTQSTFTSNQSSCCIRTFHSSASVILHYSTTTWHTFGVRTLHSSRYFLLLNIQDSCRVLVMIYTATNNFPWDLWTAVQKLCEHFRSSRQMFPSKPNLHSRLTQDQWNHDYQYYAFWQMQLPLKYPLVVVPCTTSVRPPNIKLKLKENNYSRSFLFPIMIQAIASVVAMVTVAIEVPFL